MPEWCHNQTVPLPEIDSTGLADLALATVTALQPIDCDDNIGPLEYLNQSIKKALVVMRFRLEILF